MISKRIKFLFSILCILSCSWTGKAQLPKWLVRPSYDDMKVKVDEKLIITDSLGISALWTFDGRKLFATSDSILDYHEDIAVLLEKESGSIVGIVDIEGNCTILPKSEIVYGIDHYEDGYLIFRDKKGYGFYDKTGTPVRIAKANKIYPIHRGFAPYLAFQQMENGKEKDPYFHYFVADGSRISYECEGKPFENKDVNFLSGIGSDGRGIAIVKNKLYWFHSDERRFEALSMEDTKGKSYQFSVEDGVVAALHRGSRGRNMVIPANAGKKGSAQFELNEDMVPIKIVLNGDTTVFSSSSLSDFQYSHHLTETVEDGRYGLYYNEEPFLPAQFDSIGVLYSNKGFVKTNGKWGILEAVDGLDYKLSMNKGVDISFRHQFNPAIVRLDLPRSISSSEARLDIPESSGCVLDKTSRVIKDTESGNFVQYECSLAMPMNITDNVGEFDYTFGVSYDGILLYPRTLSIRGWHNKYHNADIIDSETSYKNGSAMFTINIDVKKQVGDEDYPFDVSLNAMDSLSVKYEKLSETRFRCKVENLVEGKNIFNVIVTEKGCPPCVFPFSINYIPPQPAEKKEESLTIGRIVL